MKGYSATEIFAQFEQALLRRAEALVAAVDDPSGDVRCHELARAVGRILDLPVEDGAYGACDHSWLVIRPDMFASPCILDVYAVGRLPIVQLVDARQILQPHFSAYQKREPRDDIREDVVERLVEQMRGSA